MFKNPPLVELVAELKWDLPPSQTNEVPHITIGNRSIPFVSNSDEEGFTLLLDKFAKEGFSTTERKIPREFPMLPHQIIYRIDKSDDPDKRIIYQVGHGIFSTNAVQPYRSWDEFSDYLRRGIKNLLSAKDKLSIKKFSSINLRYVNAFTPYFTDGLSIADFLRNVIGFNLTMPEVISKLCTDLSLVQPAFQLKIPIGEGIKLKIIIGEGQVNNAESIVIDLSISNIVGIDADEDATFEAFKNAHDVLRKVFIDITKHIHDKMNTEES